MTNYLKKILFSLLIVMMPYMNSASNAGGDEEQSRSTYTTCKKKDVKDDQNDLSSFAKQSPSLKEVRLDEPQNSLTSYLSSSAKSVAQSAYYLLDYSTRNPQKAVIIGLFMASQFLATDAACACYCYNNGPKFYGKCASDMGDCTYFCSTLTFPAFYCIDKDKGC